jgi:autotransporter passenger strand-loop-strand repeat protein
VGSGAVLTDNYAENVTVRSGGTIEGFGPDFATNLVLERGATEIIAGIAPVLNLKVATGITVEATEATLSNVTVASGGNLVIGNGGTVTGVNLAEGAHLGVVSGGILGGQTVSKGVTLTVSSGGTATTTVIAGGTMIVSSDGIVRGGVTFSGGGLLSLQGKPTSAPSISGFAAADRLDLAAFTFRAGEKLSFVENKAKTSGTLTIADGALRASITLFGNYTAAGFHTASAGVGGTVITYSSASASTHTDLAVGHG